MKKKKSRSEVLVFETRVGKIILGSSGPLKKRRRIAVANGEVQARAPQYHGERQEEEEEKEEEG